MSGQSGKSVSRTTTATATAPNHQATDSLRPQQERYHQTGFRAISPVPTHGWVCGQAVSRGQLFVRTLDGWPRSWQSGAIVGQGAETLEFRGRSRESAGDVGLSFFPLAQAQDSRIYKTEKWWPVLDACSSRIRNPKCVSMTASRSWTAGTVAITTSDSVKRSLPRQIRTMNGEGPGMTLEIACPPPSRARASFAASGNLCRGHREREPRPGSGPEGAAQGPRILATVDGRAGVGNAYMTLPSSRAQASVRASSASISAMPFTAYWARASFRDTPQ